LGIRCLSLLASAQSPQNPILPQGGGPGAAPAVLMGPGLADLPTSAFTAGGAQYRKASTEIQLKLLKGGGGGRKERKRKKPLWK